MRTVNREQAVMAEQATPLRSLVHRAPTTVFSSDPNKTEQNRTEPNAFRRPPDLNDGGNTRKNLKKAERPGHAISRESQGMHPPTLVEKKLRRRLKLGQPSSPVPPTSPRHSERAARLPLHPQNRRQAAKTTPKLAKTVHLQRAISCKTQGIRPFCAAAEKFPETPSTRESQP